MEDSARFLYLAGGILVGILILTLAVYLFANFSKGATNIQNQMAADQIEKFNSSYISYEGKDGITIYDIVNLARKARDYNEQNGVEQITQFGHISVVHYPNETKFQKDNINKTFGSNGTDLTDTGVISNSDLIESYLVLEGRDEVYNQRDLDATPIPGTLQLPKNYLPEFVCPSEGIKVYTESGRIHYICFYKKN